MPIQYPGIDGFLGTRASLMLDLIVVAIGGVLVILGWSVYEVKYRRRYELHKRVQIILAVVLLLAVTAFEIDIRLHGWEDRAAGQIGGSASTVVRNVLLVHLFFAITTVILWPVVIIRALRHFPHPPAPAAHSRWHIFWARLAALDMLGTAVTGWLFYWMAFAG
jgi:uncharacterized membrane protein YozB (DUF420 family)